MKLFVYGTLKRGHGNNGLLAGEEFVKEAETAPAYKIFSNGYYPVLVPAEDGVSVKGEIWNVTNESRLRRIDSMEIGAGYKRDTIKMADKEEGVEGYIFLHKIPDHYRNCGNEWNGK